MKVHNSNERLRMIMNDSRRYVKVQMMVHESEGRKVMNDQNCKLFVNFYFQRKIRRNTHCFRNWKRDANLFLGIIIGIIPLKNIFNLILKFYDIISQKSKN